MLFALLFSSCSESPVDTVFFNFSGDHGVYIVNEGNFMYGNSSLSFYNPDTKRVYNQVFQARNGVPLGDVAQSMSIWKNLGFIVINNSGKIYIIDHSTGEYKGHISGLSSPRYVHIINEKKAYITDLYSKKITIFNPTTFQVTGFIPVGNSNSEFSQHSTEQMVQYKNLIFTNCWSFDNKILVINSDTDQLVDSIEVFKQPNSIVIDRDNKIWVLSDGGFEGSPYGYEQAGLLKINAETHEIERTFRFDKNDRPMNLCINPTKDTLYFLNRHVWKMAVTEKHLPEKAFITSKYTSLYGGFFSVAIDPTNRDVYIGDAIDHRQNGLIYRYDASGSLIDSFKAGISPGDFAFITE
ncbi:MAG TPA: cell surface protein [Prolixibacteraceae bacterium]|nr:cell surface protein [Prolixibacteraceae bacterium]